MTDQRENLYPSFDEFKRLAKKGNLVPVHLDVMADQITPVSILAANWKKNRNCFLLESVEGGENLGRYSIVSFDPELVLSGKDGGTEIRHRRRKRIERSAKSILDVLRATLKNYRPVPVAGLPRFFGGAVGYCGYETVQNFEVLPKTNPDTLGWPESLFFITGDLFVFDNTQQLLKIISCVRIKNKSDVKAAYGRARGRIFRNLEQLRRVGRGGPPPRFPKGRPTGEFRSTPDRPSFIEAVRHAKEYIRAGDVIQVVLSRRMEKKTTASPLDIYRALRVVNPSPYMYLMKFDGRAVIGSSPESLARLEDGVATTRPIAGTRRRGETPRQDAKLERNLLNDPKEIAEHIMLVDLGRNDLGRVCRFGSVRVPTFMAVERYSHVMHIVSEVRGEMKRGKDALDLLKNVFPAGTLSGAPKIRAMEIIDELETCQRGPYGGALGYVSFSGNMDFAIVIRTILYDSGRVSLQAGAGIVADSLPAREFDETENKAAGMKQTIRMAEQSHLFWERS